MRLEIPCLEIPHPVESSVPHIGLPVKLTGTPRRVRLPPPRLGEHTDAILAEMGFDREAMAQLGAGGAFSA